MMISSMAADTPQHSSLLSAIATVTSAANSTVVPSCIQTVASTEQTALDSLIANDALASILKATNGPSPSSNHHDEGPSDGEHEQGDVLDTSEGTTSSEAVESVENLLEAQQKAFQKFTSQLSGFPLRSPFQLSNLSPFLAALQQQQQNSQLHQQFLNLASSASNGSSNRESPDHDCDGDTEHGHTHGEPEDLSLGKDKKGDADDNSSCTAAPSNWSYEEQFKQLYDISDDPKRKEWLDDWLSFMHRIGKPVTRIPIMAKQVLDLYELYRLVVQHGGLVEIINKKLWREITKGLNLPSSITSAAFTLRTQYQKYLYDFECERENLSTPPDLQAAIEGNRREGRRNAAMSTPSVTSVANLTSNGGASQSFPFPLVPHTAAMAAANSFFGKHLNAFGLRQEDDHSGLTTGLPTSTQQALAAAAAYKVEQLAGFEAQQRQFDIFQRAAAEAAARHHKRPAASSTQHSDRDSTSSFDSDGATSAKRRRNDVTTNGSHARTESPTDSSQPVRIDQLLQNSQSTHMKLTSARTPTGENTMVVSLEVNGMMYQGVLFAVNSNGAAASQTPLQLAANATDLSELLNGESA